MYELPDPRRLLHAVTWRMRRLRDRGSLLPEIRRLPETTTEIGFSFDDGPTPDTTPPLLSVLRQYGATATFFVTGERAARAADLLQDLVRAGHDIFPHGWRHIRYGLEPPEEVVTDLERTEAVLSRVRPAPTPYLVRLPYGSGHRDPRLHRAIRNWNPSAQIAHWNLVTRDWELADECDNEGQLTSRCHAAAEQVMNRRDLPGSILLMHEEPFDVTARLNARVAPLMTSALLSRMSRRGLKGTRLIVAPERPSRSL